MELLNLAHSNFVAHAIFRFTLTWLLYTKPSNKYLPCVLVDCMFTTSCIPTATRRPSHESYLLSLTRLSNEQDPNHYMYASVIRMVHTTGMTTPIPHMRSVVGWATKLGLSSATTTNLLENPPSKSAFSKFGLPLYNNNC